MSKLKEYAKKRTSEYRGFEDERVENFMGGNSYTLNPLSTLRLIACSSIFGEPSYYRKSELSNKKYLKETIFSGLFKDSKYTEDIFTKAIDASLDFDFKGTLEFAKELRNDFYMRLNPAVIFVRASLHTKKAEFNLTNKDFMKNIGLSIINRPDDITNQFEYYMFLQKSKKGMPYALKRTWAKSLAYTSDYQLNKYKNKSLIDLCRICHPHSVKYNPTIDELLKTGSIKVAEEKKTWEQLRSEKKSWEEILQAVKIPHMALLRNLRGIFTEVHNSEIATKVLSELEEGVVKGKQFPFRYWSAMRAIEDAEVNNKGKILDSLEVCMDKAMSNFPKLKGRTICLCDNSGSATGTFNSEYGSVTVAEIANLSSIITGINSDEGEIGVFGDKLKFIPISKRNGALVQLKEANAEGKKIGQRTENGIWLFFDKAIKEKIKYDNIFIYSDMQAGHGELYGLNKSEYFKYALKGDNDYIDVLKLAQKYRDTVNSKVNLFSVQVAGYDNAVLPENYYRTAVLSGWTGKEVLYAEKFISEWDKVESNLKNK